jgi:hypothetical protein
VKALGALDGLPAVGARIPRPTVRQKTVPQKTAPQKTVPQRTTPPG